MNELLDDDNQISKHAVEAMSRWHDKKQEESTQTKEATGD